MSTILAIETSTEIASAAILAGERMLSQQASGVQNHSQTLLPMVQSLLQQAGLRLQDCDAIAFGAGPGSFTGVRTACGIAQGLAFGLGLPVCPVSTLLAMAERARLEAGVTEVMPVLDARMGEVYWAHYRFDGAWQTVAEPALAHPASLSPVSGVTACGNGLLLALQIAAHGLCQPQDGGTGTAGVATGPIASSLTAHSGTAGIAAAPLTSGTASAIMPHAEQIAKLGQLAFEAGAGLPAEAAQPLYLRNNVAQTTAERAMRGAAR